MPRCLRSGKRAFVLFAQALFVFALAGPGLAAPSASPQRPTLETVQRRAFDFFWRESDPKTGLTKDRATNLGDGPDRHTVASIAATGYALAALPIGVTHGWVSRQAAYARAVTTLRFVHDRLPQAHGFYYHFEDWRTGARAWNCELSSCDSALLALGGLAAGEYWPGTPVQRLADEIAGRLDWRWMQTEGGLMSDSMAPSMGGTPEKGWLAARWQGYSEASYLYLLGLGTPGHGLTRAAWNAWTFPAVMEEGYRVFGGPSPLFMAQMTPGFFDLRGLRDRQGRDWWGAWRNAHLADMAYCAHHPENKTYAAGFWGINASDRPGGYGVDRPVDGQNSGTVTPTAMLAGIVFVPGRSEKALANLWTLRGRLWGRYGFSEAFNLDKDWYDPDVVGIDLGMMLLSVENAHTGLIWRLMGRNPFLQRGLAGAGLRIDKADHFL